MALAQARLDKMTITAPFGGIVGLRSVSVGDYVNQGQDLAPLEAIDPLKVDFRVPEMYLSKVGVGQQLTVRLDALPGQERQGVVYAVSPLVDAGGHRILLRATVANKGRGAAAGHVRPGAAAVQPGQGAGRPGGRAVALGRNAVRLPGQERRGGAAREVTIGERREGAWKS